MIARPLILSALVALVLAGCSHGSDKPLPASAAAAMADWRHVATVADRERLAGWRETWVRAVTRARAAGNGPALDAEGALFQPDAALDRPLPPPGQYRCRMTKLGAKQAGMLDYIAYPPFTCQVAGEGGVSSLTKLNGSQRPVGLMLPGDARHMVFLGTMMLSDERTAQRYGRDPERDMVGRVERIGDRRWRLVLPEPRWESLTDVLELVPA